MPPDNDVSAHSIVDALADLYHKARIYRCNTTSSIAD